MTSESPGSLGMPKSLFTMLIWKSASMTNTFLPVCAMEIARFIMTKVFPSRVAGLLTARTRADSTFKRAVRRILKASVKK